MIDQDLHLAKTFLEARSHNAFSDRPVEDALLRRIYEIARMAPTTANTQPMRMVFVRSQEAKEKLKPALMPGNLDKTMAAPVTAIVAYDLEFHAKVPKLFPSRPEMATMFAGMDDTRREWLLLQNASLQAGYFIIAARSLGLDCGPMGGFDRPKTDEAFFTGTTWRSIMLINLGYGIAEKLFPRNPRLDFDEACKIV